MKKHFLYTFALTALFFQDKAQSWDWAATYGKESGQATALKADHQGNILSSVNAAFPYPGAVSSCYPHSFLAKHDSTGMVIWTQSAKYHNEFIYDISVDHVNNIYVTGAIGQTTLCGGLLADIPVSIANAGTHAFIAKYRPTGDLVWADHWSYQGIYTTEGLNIAADSAGYSYVSGFAAEQNKTGTFLKKFDPSGQSLWTIDFGESFIYDLDLDGSGLYITGGFRDSLKIGNTVIYPNVSQCVICSTGFIGKLGVNGNVLWLIKYGTTHTYIEDLTLDGQGHFFAGGNCVNGCSLTACTPSLAGFVARYDVNGNLLSSISAQPKIEHGVTDENGNYYCAGNFRRTSLFGFGTDTLSLKTTRQYGEMYVVKYDPFLGAKWVFAPVTSTNHIYYVKPEELTSDKKGHIYLGATFLPGTTAIGSTTLVNNNTYFASGDAFIAKLNLQPLTPPVGIKDESGPEDPVFFPNPTQDFVTISGLKTGSSRSIIISDIFGRKIHEINGITANDHRIDLSSRPPGIYIVEIRSNEEHLVKKVTRE